MNRLVLICEGGIHLTEYLHKNKVFPSCLLMEPEHLADTVAYFKKDDDVLFIIHGLTEFNVREVYGILDKLSEFKDKYKRLTIMSDVKLGTIPYDYYYYKGDLFYGECSLVSNNVMHSLDSNGNITKKKKRKVGDKNPIMWLFKKYNGKDCKLKIYGKQVLRPTPIIVPNAYESKIKCIEIMSEDKLEIME